MGSVPEVSWRVQFTSMRSRCSASIPIAQSCFRLSYWKTTGRSHPRMPHYLWTLSRRSCAECRQCAVFCCAASRPPPVVSIEYREREEERLPPPRGSMLGKSGLLLGESSETPLLLQWQEGIQPESLGTQFSAENPNSLGGKRSYAPFVSADGTTSSQVGNQTGLPHSEPRPDPPLGSWGSGLGGLVQYGSRGGANPNEFG